MRLLLFSDLHCDLSAARRLVERSRDADVVIGAGDFGNVRRDLQPCIDALSGIACPAVLVPGNNESLEELRAACRAWPQAHVLHGTGVALLGEHFHGLGGGVPVTPFGSWSFDFSEEQAAELLKDCPPGAVLVSHSPPKGIVDESRGRSLGSVAVRDLILKAHPRLVVCGHIHNSAGRHGYLDRTPVVNAGPAGLAWEIAPG